MKAEEFIEKWAKENFVDRDNWFDDAVKECMESYAREQVKTELTKFLDFLLKNGYCDADVYAEPPSAIDRYMHLELNK